MSLSTLTKRSVVLLALIESSLAKGLATVTPCPDCRPTIAPKPVVITAQYQTVSTCEPSTTTIVYPYTKVYTTGTTTSTTTGTTSSIETVASCSPYAWVSTMIPVYYNASKTSSLVTTTNQPVTFNSLHYTETHSTTVTLPGHNWKGNGTYGRNMTHPSTTVKVHHTTIDVKDYCEYDSIGPIAIPGYKGSDLCTDCGPDANSALTQRLTVVSCANKHCTTFNETWIVSPKTYSSEGKVHTTATTNTYCPTATPVTAMPGYTHSGPSGPAASPSPGSSSNASPSGNSSQPKGYATEPTVPSPTVTAQPTATNDYDSGTAGPTPTDGYEHGNPAPTTTDDYDDDNPASTPTDDYGGGSPDPSGDVAYEHPAPSPYHPGPASYKVFKRQGLEKPRGKVMKRSGLLFFQN